jgi:hypothetical protein
MSQARRKASSSPPASEEEPEFGLSSGDEDLEPIRGSQVIPIEAEENWSPEDEQVQGVSPPATPARTTPVIARGSSVGTRHTPVREPAYLYEQVSNLMDLDP